MIGTAPRASLIVLLVVVGFVLRVAAFQQTSTIQGSIVDFVSGQRLPDAQIYLSGAGNFRATSDNSGGFVIQDVDPGEYKVEVSLEGYFWLKGRSGSSVLTINAGDLRNLTYRLARGSAISGRILDYNGEPDSGIGVAVYRAEYRNGIRMLTRVNSPSGTRSSTSTNREGEYRLYGLEPGQYYLTAGGSETLTYYPGTPSAGAAVPLTLAPGRDLTGVNITQVRSRMFTVTIQVPQATDSLSVAGATVRPRNSSQLQELGNAPGFRAIGNNRHISAPMKPGEYELVWDVLRPPRLSGRVEFEIVDHDVDAGTLVLSPGITISGRIHISNVKAQVNPVRIQLTRVNSTTPGISSPVALDGSFKLSGVTEGEYWAEISLPRDYRDLYVQSVRYGARLPQRGDILVGTEPEGALEIALGIGSTVSGIVRNARGEAAPYSSVLLYPASGQSRPGSSKTAETDQNGFFTIPGVGPGEYRALAWEDALPSLHLDPEFQRTLTPRATAVVVSSGTPATLDLRVVPRNQ